jgi:hypothetical protein
MAKMVWDQLGGRFYEAGVDHGVLYLTDNSGVPWNGLTAVDEKLSDDSKPYYLDGVKYLDAEILGDFSVTLKAVMYPDEFEQFDGVGVFGNGLFVHDQRSKCFGLSYRTRIGNDVAGADLGYKIHILYNLTAVPDAKGYASHSATPALSTFSWTLIGKPESTPGYRPTAYVVLDSIELEAAFLAKLEAILYGTTTAAPRLPSFQELTDLAREWVTITITDNGDGTWTAVGDDHLIKMLDATTFEISEVDGTYSDENTYTISTTEP